MKTNELEMKLRNAIADACASGMPEADAISAALNVASEWEMRQQELEEENADA
jgi:hypothetical protein